MIMLILITVVFSVLTVLSVSYTHLDVYKRQALEAAEVQPPVKKDRKPLYLCHGDLDQHHVLMGGSYTAIIEYNRMHLGIQISDLYRFMRLSLIHIWWPTR